MSLDKHEGAQREWKSFLDALVKAFAMCDPVAYLYYLDAERETARHAALTPYCETGHKHDEQWAVLHERIGLWPDYEDAGLSRPENSSWSDSKRHYLPNI